MFLFHSIKTTGSGVVSIIEELIIKYTFMQIITTIVAINATDKNLADIFLFK